MGKMFLMCGMSGAGKTTFAKKFAEENGYTYLGIDDIYEWYKHIPIQCGNGKVRYQNHDENVYEDAHASFIVWLEFFRRIHFIEQRGENVVIDTNAPTFVKRAQFIDWFPTFNEHNLIYIAAGHDLRRRNNAARSRVVPDDEMECMEQEFKAPVAFWDGRATILEPEWDNVKVYLNEDNNLREIPVCNYK